MCLRIGWSALQNEEEWRLLDIVVDALTGKPDFNEYIVRGIGAGFTSYQTQRFVASKHILTSPRAMQNISNMLLSHGEKWEREDLYQELACVLWPIIQRAKHNETRMYFISYSFRYAVIAFLKKTVKEEIDEECMLSETAYVADWIRGECNEVFGKLSPMERQLVMQITEKVHTISSAGRMYGYTRQWTSHLYHEATKKLHV